MLRLVLAFVLLAPGAAAQAAYSVTVPTTGLEGDALDAFERGVELLHSFEYDDARDAFREAQGHAPYAEMAYWGEAMTHNHPVWQRQDADAAQAVFDTLSARLGAPDAPPVPPLEPEVSSYMSAARILFGEGDPETKEARDDAYLDAMARHIDRFARDRDGRAFYALALLGSAHEGRDYAVYGRAAEVAQSVLDEDPEHPGALHYLIHAYDDPDHAELALPAARAYSEIVSAASHALHMPTHIYFALGLWEEASALNVRAFEAARDASVRRGEPLNNHGWHALYWLNYSELQLGRDAEALALLDTARTRYEADPSGLALRHLTRIRAQTVVTLMMTNLTPDGPIVDDSALARAYAMDLPLDDADATTRAADLATMAVLTSSGYGDPVYVRVRSILDDSTASPLARAIAGMLPDSPEASADNASSIPNVVTAAEVIQSMPVTFGPPTPALLPHEILAWMGLESGDRDLVRCVLDAVDARAPGRRIAGIYRKALDASATRPQQSAPDLTPAFCRGD